MTRQPIYIAYAVTSDKEGLMPVCWHTSKQRAGEVGEELALGEGLKFYGVLGCNHADYLAMNSFSDDHRLNAKKP
ncbi:hypothetical protein [Nostoc sp. CHAB 5715]|uniref:hypothetical protein n=1 Tax=Nostoc sp. CHAB 5715 TaxID=2780400 RepID=UPI001E286FB6|nr:hypothetical protein [Nostoc sp. CHAB 5715]MCC5623259.1 hypothetical protein [Nostoc sp. CHAB 5715]